MEGEIGPQFPGQGLFSQAAPVKVKVVLPLRAKMPMKNLLLLIFFLAGLMSCRNEPRGGEQPAADTAAAEKPAGQAPAAAAVPEQEARPAVSSRPAFEPARSQDVLTLTAASAQARSGAEVCVAVRVQGFINLLAIQYTLSWDPKVLEFKGVNKPGLPYLDQADFGFNRTRDGLLPFVWINDALQPTTIPDGSAIYEACFGAIGLPGQSAAIRFVESPTPFEVVNGNEEIMELRPVEGKVEIK